MASDVLDVAAMKLPTVFLVLLAHAAHADPSRAEVAIDPVSPVFGYLDAAAGVGLSRSTAITVSAAHWSKDHDQSGYQLSAGVQVFAHDRFQGPFLEAGVLLRTMIWPADLTGCINCQTVDPYDSYTWAGPQVLAGWQYTAPSGLTISGAVGVAKHLYDSYLMETGRTDPDFNAYFRAGYAF